MKEDGSENRLTQIFKNKINNDIAHRYGTVNKPFPKEFQVKRKISRFFNKNATMIKIGDITQYLKSSTVKEFLKWNKEKNGFKRLNIKKYPIKIRMHHSQFNFVFVVRFFNFILFSCSSLRFLLFDPNIIVSAASQK